MCQLHGDSACVVLVASPTNDPNPDSRCLWLSRPLVSVPPGLSRSPHLPTGTCSLRPVKGGRFLAHALLHLPSWVTLAPPVALAITRMPLAVPSVLHTRSDLESQSGFHPAASWAPWPQAPPKPSSCSLSTRPAVVHLPTP